MSRLTRPTRRAGNRPAAFPRTPSRPASRRGFTLIELMVVVGIIAVLIGLLVPAVQKAKEAANKTQCSNNLRQLGLGYLHYNTTYKEYPPGTQFVLVPPFVSHGWGAFILPYLDQEAVSKIYNMNVPFFAPPNAALIQTPIPVMQCPSSPDYNRMYFFDATPLGFPIQWTAYASDYTPTLGVMGALWGLLGGNPTVNRDGLLLENQGRPVRDVRDGMSNTILLAEQAGKTDRWVQGKLAANASEKGGGWGDPLSGAWLLGSDITGTSAPGPCVMNCTNATPPPSATWGLYSFHTAGINVLMGDGSVRFLTQGMSSRTLIYLVTAANGDLPGEF